MKTIHDNIYLLPMTFYDLLFVNRLRNTCIEYLHTKETYNIFQTIYWFFRYKPKFWMIVKDGKNIGYFRTSNWTSNSCYIGSDIIEHEREKKYAKKMYPVFMRYLKRSHGIQKIYLEVLRTNERAFNLYKKLGFVTIESDDINVKMELKL